MPGVTNGAGNRPSASDTNVRDPCGPVIVTVAPGTARFCASTTCPAMVPVVASCAMAGVVPLRTATDAPIMPKILSRVRKRPFIVLHPLYLAMARRREAHANRCHALSSRLCDVYAQAVAV